MNVSDCIKTQHPPHPKHRPNNNQMPTDYVQIELDYGAIFIKILNVAMAGYVLYANNRSSISSMCGTNVWDLLLVQAIIQTIQFSVLMCFSSLYHKSGVRMLNIIIGISFLVVGCAIYIPAKLNSDCVQLLSANDYKSLPDWPYLIIVGFVYAILNGIFLLILVGDAFFAPNSRHFR
jgi:hypothetical protein